MVVKLSGEGNVITSAENLLRTKPHIQIIPKPRRISA